MYMNLLLRISRLLDRFLFLLFLLLFGKNTASRGREKVDTVAIVEFLYFNAFAIFIAKWICNALGSSLTQS